MKSIVSIIADRICSANEDSPIAVEKVGEELRSYFSNTVKAPKDQIERKSGGFKVYGVARLMPERKPENQLGVFHGPIGAANFKKMCFDLGLSNG